MTFSPGRLARLVWLAAAALLLAVSVAGLLSARAPAHGGTGGPVAAANPPALSPAGPRPGPAEVFAGVYIANVQAVSLATNSFDADFYLWLRWTDPDIDPTAGVEVMNVYQKWGLVVTPVHEEPQRQPDGSLLWLARFQGSFNSPLTLADYPFERQNLRILIEDGIEDSQHIIYRADTEPITLDREVTLPGYSFGTPVIEFGEYTYESSFGERVSSPEDRTYPRISVDIPLSSPVVSGIVKTILPIVIVMVASALGLVIPASFVDSKVNVPIFSLLALVAMHWGVSSMLPEVNYLVMIDVLYIVAYVAVTAMLAVAVIGSWTLQSRGEAATAAMQRRALIVIGLVYVLAMAAVFLIYLA